MPCSYLLDVTNKIEKWKREKGVMMGAPREMQLIYFEDMYMSYPIIFVVVRKRLFDLMD